ncbi:glutathione S-transferase [Crepidotus variabilis]|uniref:Glutathione S-transferase n=1 Tax=Crepidotus variabilis TaxID=179855 RepID=A0A9P6E983_9AGAR|nr:glutathione S-transferase [Crepidotus variabilis]
MSTQVNASSQSEIHKLKYEPDGSFKRPESSFRSMIEKGGKFEPDKDRYHLFVSYACPWAHRTLIVRKLKGLDDIIPVSIVSPRLGPDGWPFALVDEYPGATVDPLYGSRHVKDLYFRADLNYTGRFTVPILWDKKTHTIVNNESSEIIRIFNTAFNDFLPDNKKVLDFYPEDSRPKIDELNEWIYSGINNGVYRAGLAITQEEYLKAVREVFESLDRVEKILEGKEYLLGDKLTEADIRLYVTIVRFDPVYHGHFKCNLRSIRDGYPKIDRWARKLYWTNAVFKDTTDFDHIKTHYYWSHTIINPNRIVPVGPEPDIRPL